jgi:hypothetical protein
MKDFPDKITKLSKTVIEKLTARRSATYSTWKLADWKKAEEKLNEEDRDKQEINEAVKKSLPRSMYWFKYQDKDRGDHELKIVERYIAGKIHILNIKRGDRWTDRRMERGEPDPEIYDWETGEQLA